MTARPIRHNAQVPDRNGKIFYTSFTSLSHIIKSGGHYVFVLPIDRELDLKKCAAAVGEKAVELIPVKEILPLTGYVRGGCTPIGMKKRFPTVIHKSVLGLDRIIISGGRIGAQILIAPGDLIRVTGARVGDLIQE